MKSEQSELRSSESWEVGKLRKLEIPEFPRSASRRVGKLGISGSPNSGVREFGIRAVALPDFQIPGCREVGKLNIPNARAWEAGKFGIGGWNLPSSGAREGGGWEIGESGISELSELQSSGRLEIGKLRKLELPEFPSSTGLAAGSLGMLNFQKSEVWQNGKLGKKIAPRNPSTGTQQESRWGVATLSL